MCLRNETPRLTNIPQEGYKCRLVTIKNWTWWAKCLAKLLCLLHILRHENVTSYHVWWSAALRNFKSPWCLTTSLDVFRCNYLLHKTRQGLVGLITPRSTFYVIIFHPILNYVFSVHVNLNQWVTMLNLWFLSSGLPTLSPVNTILDLFDIVWYKSTKKWSKPKKTQKMLLYTIIVMCYPCVTCESL